MGTKMTVEWLAEEINNHTKNHGLFWAAGLIRETVNLWKRPINYGLLNDAAKIIADRYMEV
ncbi:hypothetical protein LCGC14_0812830 [marine sediment metagenome]|uniref:Uncharacterized protein n=1 Tax=marine sediment metagenome TaxID=412755 RepID=A0A0F9STH1_9ZZZZ